MIKKEIIQLREQAKKIAGNPKLQRKIKKIRGKQDALAGHPATELSGPYFDEYKNVRKEIQKNNF